MNDDDRQVPYTACWWRLRLHPNEDGLYYTEFLHVGEDWTPGSYVPWSGHIDYYDGRNDWSWPFDYRVNLEYETLDHWGHDHTPIGLDKKCYLDVLDVVPPSLPTTHSPHTPWCRLTLGINYHPRGDLGSEVFYMG